MSISHCVMPHKCRPSHVCTPHLFPLKPLSDDACTFVMNTHHVRYEHSSRSIRTLITFDTRHTEANFNPYKSPRRRSEKAMREGLPCRKACASLLLEPCFIIGQIVSCRSGGFAIRPPQAKILLIGVKLIHIFHWITSPMERVWSFCLSLM